DLLKRHDGNVSQAARAAGVDWKTFYRLLNRYGLR
ncbi:MAG: helix-turn-helix domain-containing protein, partial [Candidatus Methylomirabilia bacterium]